VADNDNVDDLEVEVLALSQNAEFMAFLDACKQSRREAPPISLEQARVALGIAVEAPKLGAS
jgi:hypothetical protein